MENSNITKQFIAVRAVIIKDNKTLIIREASKYSGGTNHGKYDFPGGKIKVGEDFATALLRETKEEIGARIKINNPFFVDEWRPVVKGEKIQIIGIFFKSELMDDKITLSQDHDDYQWVDARNFHTFALIEATRGALEKLYS